MIRSQKGLTVIETLIATTLFLTGVLVLVGLYPTSARATRQAQGHLMATTLAEKELELARATSYYALENRDEKYVLKLTNNGSPMEITYNTEVVVEEVRLGLKSVTVKIDYLSPDYFNRKLEMQTYVADPIL
jgi:Tfp pilus assembly protein PilV